MRRSRNDQVEIFFEEAKIGDEKCSQPKLENRIYQKKKKNLGSKIISVILMMTKFN